MTKKNTNLSHFNKEEVSNAKGLSFGIVVSEWNGDITDGLYKGAANTLIDCGANANDIKRYDVPGSYELVFGAKIAAKNKPDAIICLGSVIQGETKHFDFVCNAVSMGIKDLNINLNIPVIFGVLTDNTMEQAKNRSGGKFGNKGVEAAITAIKMATLNRK
jgi:6,7-dimethyl-8-ribityllumazine synthase|tara:strand:- start:43 stop:525 length:483 start_codon:yes stop_codon:yes gene_type:complete